MSGIRRLVLAQRFRSIAAEFRALPRNLPPGPFGYAGGADYARLAALAWQTVIEAVEKNVLLLPQGPRPGRRRQWRAEGRLETPPSQETLANLEQEELDEFGFFPSHRYLQEMVNCWNATAKPNPPIVYWETLCACRINPVMPGLDPMLKYMASGPQRSAAVCDLLAAFVERTLVQLQLVASPNCDDSAKRVADAQQLAAAFGRIADDLHRCRTTYTKGEHLAGNLSDFGPRLGRLVQDAADAGAFAGESWWRRGEPPGFDRMTRNFMGGIAGAVAADEDDYYTRLWAVCIGSWLAKKYPSRLEARAAERLWTTVATDASGRPIDKSGRTIRGAYFDSNGRRMPDGFKPPKGREHEYTGKLDGQIAREHDFYDDADSTHHAERRARVYEDAARLLAELIAPAAALQAETPEPAASDAWYPAKHYEQYNISGDTLRQAAREDRIRKRKGNGNRNHYCDADVRRAWPHLFPREAWAS